VTDEVNVVRPPVDASEADAALLEQHVNSVIADCQYMCSLVCAVTQVADELALRAGYASSDCEQKSPGPIRVAYLELSKAKIGGSSEELLRSAIALYLYALGRMRDAMTRVAATKKSVPVEAASVESLSKLAEVSTI